METLNRLTVVRGEKRDGDCLKEVKGLVKEHIQRTHGYGQWCGDYLWKWGVGSVEGGKGGNWDTYNSINNNKINKFDYL